MPTPPIPSSPIGAVTDAAAFFCSQWVRTQTATFTPSA
jgi:hypothetical protein